LEALLIVYLTGYLQISAVALIIRKIHRKFHSTNESDLQIFNFCMFMGLVA